jgi:hypothetical protein
LSTVNVSTEWIFSGGGRAGRLVDGLEAAR